MRKIQVKFLRSYNRDAVRTFVQDMVGNTCRKFVRPLWKDIHFGRKY